MQGASSTSGHSLMTIKKYEPSQFARDHQWHPLWGLSELISRARKAGKQCLWLADECEEGDEAWEEVNSKTVRFAVTEVDEAIIQFRDRETGRAQNILIIPERGQTSPIEWACDWHVAEWLDEIMKDLNARAEVIESRPGGYRT